MATHMSAWHEYLTTREAATYLRISYRSMCELLKRQHIPHTKIGRGFRIRRADLDAWFDAQRNAPQEPPA